MNNLYDVIYTPVITEKTTGQLEQGVYTFLVSKSANKIEIARAVEELWDVKVEDVRTMRYAGKAKRAMLGRMSKDGKIGRRASFKKAVVQLAEGDQIEFYEAG